MRNRSGIIWIATAMLLLAGLSFSITPQNKIGDARLANLPALIGKQMADWRAPGAAIGIVKDGKVIFVREKDGLQGPAAADRLICRFRPIHREKVNPVNLRTSCPLDLGFCLDPLHLRHHPLEHGQVWKNWNRKQFLA